MLTESKISAMRPKKSRYMICDGDGLYLEVRPNGGMSWIYRSRVGGILQKVVIGSYPQMGIYEARMTRDAVREGKSIDADGKPKQTEKTFFDVAEEWIERKYRGTVTLKTVNKQISRLGRYIYPVLGHKAPDEITAQEVLAMLAEIEERGYTDTAADIKQLTSQVLRYAVVKGLAERDVTVDLRGALRPHQGGHMAALLTPADIRGFLLSLDAVQPSVPKCCLLFTILCMCRGGEARHAEWSEIDYNNRMWHIPAKKMKMRRPHLVPLSRQAMDIIRIMHQMTGKKGDLIFQSTRATGKPVSDVAMMALIRRLGYERGTVHIHGFRSMASTILNERQFPPDCIERQLAHSGGSSVRAVYNYAQWIPQRRLMLQWYADYLDALKMGKNEPPLPDFVRN